MEQIYVGQNVGKDSVVGDIQMNRYSVFNGLERPRRIGPELSATLLGWDTPPNITSIVTDATAGNLDNNKWYGYAIAYASAKYTRPVATEDASSNYTRSNTSNVLSQDSGAFTSLKLTLVGSDDPATTHILIYRTLAKATEAEADLGLLFYVGQVANASGAVTYIDSLDENLMGMEAEQNNYPPHSYRYAVDVRGFIFAGGSVVLGEGATCTVTNGSPTVTIAGGVTMWDGIRGWQLTIDGQTTGGLDGSGLWFATYVNATTLQLVDSTGTPTNFVAGTGHPAGSGLTFVLRDSGNVLRWSKQFEPEAWPLDNIITFCGDITGMIQIPNQPLLLVCTSEPSMYILDVNLIGTNNFKTQKFSVSTTFTASSHYSLVNVEGKVRGIDAALGCIFEVDGTNVRDLTKDVIPKVFKYLTQDANLICNWHCAYDQRQKIFGAFVTFAGANRLIDFCIGQNLVTGNWFFNYEKDLLCTGQYRDPVSGEYIVLGGTEGLGYTGAVWGRVWAPQTYDDWFPGGLRSGGIVSATAPLTITVDNTLEDLHTAHGGLAGRWLLMVDPEGSSAQLGYILSNTADTIVLESVIGSQSFDAMYPVPVSGWHFYIGLIECRWGPKLTDLGDPEIRKKIQEVWCCVSDYDSGYLPFFRIGRGFNSADMEQIALREYYNLDLTANQTLGNQVSSKREPLPRFSLSWMDRSYGPVLLHSISLIFLPATRPQGTDTKEKV